MSKAKGIKPRNLTGQEKSGSIPTLPPTGIHGTIELPDNIEDIKTFIRSRIARSRGEFVIGDIEYTTLTIDGKKYVMFEVD